jgi:hypothetical protein
MSERSVKTLNLLLYPSGFVNPFVGINIFLLDVEKLYFYNIYSLLY